MSSGNGPLSRVVQQHLGHVAQRTRGRGLGMRQADGALSHDGSIDVQIVHQKSVALEIPAQVSFGAACEPLEGSLRLASPAGPVHGDTDPRARMQAEQELEEIAMAMMVMMLAVA